MMPSFFPGNLAMMLFIGNAPTGVFAVKVSFSTSTPLSFEWMYCSSLACPELPGGREPNATISFTYCITWLPLMSGLGAALPESVSGVAAGTAGGAFVVATGLISADAADGVCLLHPELTPATRTSTQRTSGEKDIRRSFMLQLL